MFDFLERTLPLLGEAALDKLANSRVALLGLGGVGSAAAEALCRAGVGQLLLVDNDTVSLSNRNRQLVATTQTLGLPKTQAAAQRLLTINPACTIDTAQRFYLPEQSAFLYDWHPDCVLDAIDTVTAKLHLAEQCRARGIPLLSSMGTGNRLDPSQLRLGDLADTVGNGCPLARVMRRELKKRGLEHLPVVYSVEPPLTAVCVGAENGRHPPASSAFVPPAAGFLLAYGGVKALLEQTGAR
ncbi:MAG: tRNA threonylcarbamoyladenosine dehydratase [Angelakisella sp.]